MDICRNVWKAKQAILEEKMFKLSKTRRAPVLLKLEEQKTYRKQQVMTAGKCLPPRTEPPAQPPLLQNSAFSWIHAKRKML